MARKKSAKKKTRGVSRTKRKTASSRKMPQKGTGKELKSSKKAPATRGKRKVSLGGVEDERPRVESAKTALSNRTDQLAEALIFAEPSDLDSLKTLKELLEDISKWAAEQSHVKLSELAHVAAGIVETIAEQDLGNAESTFEKIGRFVIALQAVVYGGHDPSEIEWSPEAAPEASDEIAFEEQVSADTDQTKSRSLLSDSGLEPDLLLEFLAQQQSNLEEMERLILNLDKPQGANQVTPLGRLLHSLKGEAGLLGLDEVERLCHMIEEVLPVAKPSEMVDCLLKAKDWLQLKFKSCAGDSVQLPNLNGILALFESLLERKTATEKSRLKKTTRGVQSPLASDPELMQDFINEAGEHIESADVNLLTLETAPDDSEALNAVFRAYHTIKGIASFLALDEVGSLAHETENLLAKIRSKEVILDSQRIDLLFDASDAMKSLVARLREFLESGEAPAQEEALPQLLGRIKAAASGEAEPQPVPEPHVVVPRKRLGEILVESGLTTEERINDVLSRQDQSAEPKPLGELLVKESQVQAREVAKALREQKTGYRTATGVHVRETLKVDAERLDRLVDTIGELVIAESMVTQSPELQGMVSDHLAKDFARLDKITRELQEMGTSLRMVPLRSTFQKMARLVRDLAKDAGRSVEFVTSGEDTELDKTVVEKMADPLVHLIRNAVDHGIEPDMQERLDKGKPAVGRIELRAFHKGGNIHIEIEDDGRGLDRETILATARRKGLVTDGDSMSDSEVYSLIFRPGFSTVKEVTKVSGRGVGMDVVKRNVDALRGQIRVQSTKDKGSIFSVILPLTLAIIDGMVIRVAHERYIIPILSIAKSVSPSQEDITLVPNQGPVLSFQEEFVPLLRLGGVFDASQADEIAGRLVVIVEDSGRRLGLVVDELLGQQQTVIKSLGEAMGSIRGVSGGAIMPDGQVGLILDIPGLMQLAGSEDRLHIPAVSSMQV